MKPLLSNISTVEVSLCDNMLNTFRSCLHEMICICRFDLNLCIGKSKLHKRSLGHDLRTYEVGKF